MPPNVGSTDGEDDEALEKEPHIRFSASSVRVSKETISRTDETISRELENIRKQTRP
jgi:hypothetical protein